MGQRRPARRGRQGQKIMLLPACYQSESIFLLALVSA
jgi:hypothetical protein